MTHEGSGGASGQDRWDVAVVGGGIGGLASAALAARRGATVCLLERASTLGGRGASQDKDGFILNLGGHALYRGGPAERVLGSLGVLYTGSPPPVAGLALHEGRTHVLPAGPLSLLRTGLLGARGKLESAKLLASLGRIDTAPLRSTTLRAWLEREIHDARARQVFEMFVRLTTYANAPELVSAGAAIDQLRLGQTKGVLYLDGGWQTLVEGLSAKAREHGARIDPGADVRRVEHGPGGYLLRDADGREIHARAVVLAVPPRIAASLVTGPARRALDAWSEDAVPARAACLDVALDAMPVPKERFALGVDAPLYYSVHSSVARLAPDGKALVHLMKYLAPGDDGHGGEDALTGVLDLLQPGWRDRVVHRRYLPAMVATNAIVKAAGGGLLGRPGPRVPGEEGLFVVGDWVGQEGMLADASLASAWQTDLALAEPAPACSATGT